MNHAADDLQSIPQRLRVGSSVYEIHTKSGPKNTVLTYDDGPEPMGTTKVLEVLEERNATATFFVLLSRTRETPSIVGDILSKGHEIGLHGLNHKSLRDMNSEEVFIRTYRAKQELEQLTGRPVRWFRPPYGHQTLETWKGVVRAGLLPVVWSVQCNDWEDARSEDYKQYLTEVEAIKFPGSIILAHDNFASRMDEAADAPPPRFCRGRLARLILDAVQERGFSCCSLENAIETGDLILKSWFRT
ncbi:MAG: polysaccharide deacetylase family protein [Candidatus Nanopelagicaceae bacterium]|nr:polysaccharide deacetylase family protein [Candidatus Nanopelagicaceae bacterium]